MFIFRRNEDLGFSLGINPIWIHKHMKDSRYHFHMFFELGFWYLEIQIGREI